MPYVRCPGCGLPSYAVARHSTDEDCSRCGAQLLPPADSGPALARKLTPDLTAPAMARIALRRFADRVAPEDMETIELLSTEVVGNAVRHAALDGGAPISVQAFLDADRIRIEVHDAGPGFVPSVMEPDPRNPNGRGLFLVDSLASEWGVTRSAGTTVWFEVALAPR